MNELGVTPAAPRISVVIPTFKRPALLLRCLSGVLAQTLPAEDYEVIVVDDGHDEETRRAVEALARELPKIASVRYLRPPTGRGPAVARNAGWRAARGALLAFTDDDTVPSSGWLADGERSMREHPEWVALRGRVEVPVECERTDHARMTQGLESAEFVTANAFVWRHAMEAVGGFDERFTRAWCEDSDLQFRLADEAGPVGRIDTAAVKHPVRPAPWGLSLSQQRNAYFDALLFKKHPQRYRERIHPMPPWNYYAIVVLFAAALGFAAFGVALGAAFSLVAAAALVLEFAYRRLRDTSHALHHVAEMLVTSALIPFLSVYWRLRGAVHFRVMFL